MNRRDFVCTGSMALLTLQDMPSFAIKHGQDAGIARFRKSIGEPAWAKLKDRLDSLNYTIRTRSIHAFPGSKEKLETGYVYDTYFDWDLYFENIYLSYYNISTYDFSNLKMFLDRQEPDGFISRMISKDGVTQRPTQMFKPFMAQIAVLGARQNHDNVALLRGNYYDRLKKYLKRWFEYDPTGSDLPVWNSCDASGMDNQYSRSGNLESYFDQGVDLACYLIQELRSMAWIAQRLGETSDHQAFLDRSKHVAAQINKIFWDEKDGFYYDRNVKTGKQIRVKSVAGFIPLWVGIAPPDRAKRLVKEHLTNPNEFWLKYPVASYAKTEPDFYEGSHKGECNWRGSTWVPANYMIFHGLVDYGFHDIARELAYKTFRMALDENDVTREYYNSETGGGNGQNPFWGWSSLAYTMPIEYELGYNPTSLATRIYPMLREQMGIQFQT
jgi:putative isomerase